VPALEQDLPGWVAQALVKGGSAGKTTALALIKEHVSAVLAHFVMVMSGQHIMFNDYDPTDFAAVVVTSDLLGPDGNPRNAGNGAESNVWAGGYGATAAGNADLLKDSFGAAKTVLDGAKVNAAQRPALLCKYARNPPVLVSSRYFF